MKRGQSNTDPAIAEQAAQWLLDLEEPRPGDLADFAAWLAASPRHVEEFLLASAIWTELDSLDPARRLQIDRLIEEARTNVRALECGAPAGRPIEQARPRWKVAAAAAAAVIAALALWFFNAGGSHIYTTALGEQRAFKLEDGSIVSLNTQSRVEVRYSDESRTVRLIEGEALFAVERDPERPFRVLADDTVIQAIGTRFNVYRTAAGTTVSVVEGIVEISPVESHRARSAQGQADGSVADVPAEQAGAAAARITAGEQARVSLGGEIVKQAVPDVASVVAWRERRLVFRGDSLQEVAREFNRYNALQIRVQGHATRGKRLTAVFDADDPQALILFLAKDEDLVVERSDREFVIRGP